MIEQNQMRLLKSGSSDADIQLLIHTLSNLSVLRLTISPALPPCVVLLSEKWTQNFAENWEDPKKLSKTTNNLSLMLINAPSVGKDSYSQSGVHPCGMYTGVLEDLLEEHIEDHLFTGRK